MDTKALGKRINKVRKDRGYTSEKLAEACNINPAYLRQLECGAKTPSLPMFVTLCRELRVSPTYLLAEVLPECDFQEMDTLLELWQQATPSQLKIITSMVKSALDSMSEP